MIRLFRRLGSAPRLSDIRAAIAEQDFGLYILGHFATTIALWMQRIAVGWLAWTLTGSEAWLGAVAFAELFPSIVSSLAGGSLADRFPRSRVMLWGQLGATAVSAALAIGHWAGLLGIEALAGLMVLLGVIAGGMLPARLAMPHLLVRPALLPAALGLNSTTFNLSRLIGPAIAAPMLVWWDAAAVFAVAFLANLAFIAILRRIDTRPRDRERPSDARTFAVIGALLRERVLAALIGTQFAQGMLVRPASELFPAFADEVFGAGAAGLSVLNAAIGAGAILGAVMLSKPRADRDALAAVTWTSAVLCLSLFLFGLTGSLWAGALLMAVHGAMMSSSNIIALAFVQAHVAADRLGRVLAVYGIVYRVAPALGALGFGLLAEAAGLGTATLVFATFGGASVVLYALAVRRA